MPLLPPRSTLFPYTTLFQSESLIVGLFTIWRGQPQDRPKPNEVCVGFSRDGFHWFRANSTGLQSATNNRHPVFFGVDRKSTRLNSSHQIISYAVFCLKKQKLELDDFRGHQVRQLLELALAIFGRRRSLGQDRPLFRTPALPDLGAVGARNELADDVSR